MPRRSHAPRVRYAGCVFMKTQLFDTIKPRTLRAEIVAMIRDAIVTGKLKPGEHLKESTIARQMSVSRIPVREAFRQLEQEGLIVSVPNQGSFVRAFDEQDVREIFSLRAALEDLACEIVIRERRLRPADFKYLEDCIRQQQEAVGAGDFGRLAELDLGFHEFICSKSESGRLLKMWRGLRAQIQVLFYQLFHARDQVPRLIGADHTAILEALRRGDLEQFSEINREINERVAGECMQVIRSMSDEHRS